MNWTKTVVALVLTGAGIVLVGQFSALKMTNVALESRLDVEAESAKAAKAAESAMQVEIEVLKTAAARREAEIAARVNELAQREAAIAGREDAATERTQSSFQGLLIQQNLLKNLEGLKASLPDMTPEVERLAREHAQFDAELQRLRKENADLRRKLIGAAPVESR